MEMPSPWSDFFQSPNDAQTQALKQLSSNAVLETIQFVDFVDVLISFYLVLNLCWANVQNSWISLRHTLTPSRPMGPAFNTLMCAASSHRKWILWDDAVTVRDCKQPSWNTAGCVKDLESLKIPSFYCLLGVNMIGEECWWERDVLVSGDLYWSLLILACKILKVFPLLLSWQTSWQMFISWGNPIWPQQFRRMFGCSSPF